MSSNTPTGPPEEPSRGETLEQGGGDPAPRSTRSGGRRTAVIGVGAVAVLGLVGGGVWAAMSFLGTGDQPAESLPAGTLGYLSVDLDPSGGQKVEALRTLNKFPIFEDKVGISPEDDLRGEIFSTLNDESDCDLDYDEDIAPWIGQRFAVAAVEAGEETPSPVAVLQVSDAGAAEDGLSALAACGEGGDSGDGGWSIEGDWAVVAETDELAETILDQAGEGSLADDEDFQRWTGEAGDPGVVTGYAAPAAGAYLAEELGSAASPLTGVPSTGDGSGEELPTELATALEDFGGAAMSVRFADGALEVETASDGSSAGPGSLTDGDQGAAAMSALPENTAAAFGLGFEEGWAGDLLDYLESTGSLEGVPVEDALAQAEAATGLSLPEDLETLLGDSAALSLGGDIDLGALTASADGSAVPVALSVQGDPEEVESVLEKVRQLAGPEAATFLGSDAEGETIVVGPSSAYREELLEDGALGDSEAFTDVVPGADDAAVVLFVNIDSFDDLIAQAAGGDPSIEENIEPLAGVGFSSSAEDDVSRSVFRVTTD